jgi:hypothetical protein
MHHDRKLSISINDIYILLYYLLNIDILLYYLLNILMIIQVEILSPLFL